MQREIKALFEFGPFSLDMSDRFLMAGNREIYLSPKAFDVLQYFVINPGMLISRAQLKSCVWAATSVSDNSIDQKIAELRKILAQVDPATEYIQNKHGQGWRFVVEVEKRQELPEQAGTEDNAALLAAALAAKSPIKGWLKIAYAVPIFVGLGVLAYLKIDDIQPKDPQVIDYRQLTVDGLPKEGRLRTDGRSLYFLERTSYNATSEYRIASTPLSGNSVTYPKMPTSPKLFFDMTTRGGNLVYWLGLKTDSKVMSVWQFEKNSLETKGLQADWASISPDGRTIVYSDSQPCLTIRSLAGSYRSRTVSLPGCPRCFRWSPDGQRIRFSVCDAFSQTCRMWEVGSDGINLRQLPISPERGRAVLPEGWTSDGRYFVFSEVGEIDQLSVLWIVRDSSKAKPVRLTAAPMSYRSALVAPGNSAIFAIGMKSRDELVKLDVKSHAFVSVWEGFPAIDVQFSNDGAYAAFSRYPDRTLWVSKADGSERRQITWPPLEANQPHWSPDGRKLAFMGHVPGRHWQIYMIEATGGSPRAVKADDPFDQGVPSWSADGRFLVFGELRNRRPDAEMVIRILDLYSNTESVLMGSKGKWSPRWSPDGRYILAQTSDFQQLDLFDCDAKSWRVLVRQASNDATWSLDGKFVHFQATTEQERSLWRVEVESGNAERLAVQPDFDYSWSGVAPDGSPLTLRALKSEEIYALDLRLP